MPSLDWREAEELTRFLDRVSAGADGDPAEVVALDARFPERRKQPRPRDLP